MGTQGSPVKSYDYLLKFLLVGDSDVGKGEILESLQDGASESPYAYSNGKRVARTIQKCAKHIVAGLAQLYRVSESGCKERRAKSSVLLHQ
uniref:Uncharacterized protein n=1 Tax=Laticauda laticaudata TaxID=8630 RepID=A0A8C5S7K6_LATLA